MQLGDGVESLAASLEQVFQDRFPQLGFGEADHTKPQSNNEVRRTGLLPLIAYDLVDSVGQRYSVLGSCQPDDPSSQLIRSGLSNDVTSSMFDNNASHCSSPISTFSHRQRNQLIDVWFSAHPLTFLISKTLLLREVREDTCDEILMAVMLADASFVIGESSMVARGHELLQWAKTQLQMRPSYISSEDKDAVYSGVPTRVYKGVTTAQTLVLLAWNALSLEEYRRAVCYVEVASKLVTQIKDYMTKDVSSPSSSRINGVDVLDVEREVVSNLWWTTFSLNLWMSIQAGVSPDINVSTLTLDSLPETETSSVSIQLDLVSENFNTLQKQKGNIREMRPLAYVVNTVAYLFSESDQAASRHGIRVCREAVRAVEGSNTTDSNLHSRSNDESQNLIVAFHQIMMIQLLFPKNGSCYDQVIVPTETVTQFCSSAEQIVRFFSRSTVHLNHHTTTASSTKDSLSKALCTLLDTCSRAFTLIRDNLGLSIEPGYFRPEWSDRLCSLASALYTLSKSNHFYQGSASKDTRKQLKDCARAFGDQGHPNALGLLGSGLNSMRSASHSPQANFEASNGFLVTSELSNDIPSPFQFIEGGSRLSSSIPSSSTSSTSVSTQPFTPFDDMNKWNISENYSHNVVGTGNLSPPPVVQRGLQQGAPIQNVWYSQATPVMNFQAAGPVSVQNNQWVWPTSSAEDTTYMSFQALDMEEA